MAFNVSEFTSQISKRGGLTRNNRFAVRFTSPPALAGRSNVVRDIEYWCEAINIPGYQLMTHNVNRWTYGVTEKRPFAPMFPQLQLQFLIDNDNSIVDLFEAWMQGIIPHNTENGINQQQSASGIVPYEVTYKEDYVTDLNLYVYSESGKIIRQIVCKEAFPVHVQDIPFAWNQTNDIAKMTVTFDFLDWFTVVV